MAARIVSDASPLSRRQPPSFVRAGLSGRTIYFPDDFLAEHDREPGQLIALLTLSLSSYLGGKRGEA